MRNNVRTGWIVVGGTLTAAAVATVALSVWLDIRLPHDYDFSFPGSYDSSLLDERTSETTTSVYSLTAPRIIVDAGGKVGIRVVPGTAGRLSVKREVTWSRGNREFSQTWEDGKTLRIRFGCPDGERTDATACRADYTLAVPSGVDVRIATASGTVSCPPATSGTVCPSGTGRG